MEVHKDPPKVTNRLGKIPRAFTPLISLGYNKRMLFVGSNPCLCHKSNGKLVTYAHNTNVNNRLFIARVSAIVGTLSSTLFIVEI